MNQPPNIAVDFDGNRLIAQFEQRIIELDLSHEDFWQKYGQLWAKADYLPFNLSPLMWQGQPLGFSEKEVCQIRQFKVLNRLQMRELYPRLPDTFGDRCLKSGALRAYVLCKAGEKYGAHSEEAIQLAAHFLGAKPLSMRNLIAVKQALQNH